MPHRYYNFLEDVRHVIYVTSLRGRVTELPNANSRTPRGKTVGIQNLQATTGDETTVFIDLCLQPYPYSIL